MKSVTTPDTSATMAFAAVASSANVGSDAAAPQRCGRDVASASARRSSSIAVIAAAASGSLRRAGCGLKITVALRASKAETIAVPIGREEWLILRSAAYQVGA